MAQYRLSEAAVSDLDSIIRYTDREYGTRQARLYGEDLIRAAQTAALFPEAGRIYRTDAGNSYRRYNCGRHSLFYRQSENGIVVVRILHGAMDADRHLD